MGPSVQQPVPTQAGGGDADGLDQIQQRLFALGEQAFQMPGAELFGHLGLIEQTDPVSLQEFDAMSPDQRAGVLMDAMENPFWTLRESLTPEGYEPWSPQDRDARMPAAADPMLAAMGGAPSPEIVSMMMPRRSA